MSDQDRYLKHLKYALSYCQLENAAVSLGSIGHDDYASMELLNSMAADAFRKTLAQVPACERRVNTTEEQEYTELLRILTTSYKEEHLHNIARTVSEWSFSDAAKLRCLQAFASERFADILKWAREGDFEND